MMPSRTPLISAISLKRADALHADVLSALHAQCFDKGWSDKSMSQLLRMPGAMALIAELGQVKPVGFIIARIAADDAEILTLAVSQGHRRLKIAQALVIETARLLAEQGARALHIEVASSNAPALKLYEKLGFSQTGKRPSYYARAGGSREDAVTMSRPLPIAPRHG